MTEMPDIETQIRFELFIQGKLMDSQKMEIQTRLQEDIEFKDMFDRYCQHRDQDTNNAVLTSEGIDISNASSRSVNMKDIQSDIEIYGSADAKTPDELEFLHAVRAVSSQYREKRISKTKIFTAAAAVLFLAVLSSIFLYSHHQNSPGALFAANYAAYPNILQTRGDNVSADPALLDGMTLYSKGDYIQAAAVLSNTLAIQQASPLETLYLGICYIETGDDQKAISVLSRIASSSPNIATHQVNWYLGLLFLKTNDIDKAKLYFSLEAATPSSYSEKARQILNKLN